MPTGPRIKSKSAAKIKKKEAAEDQKSKILVDLPQPEEEQKSGTPVDLPPVGDDEVFEEDFTDVEEGFPMAEEGSHHAKVIDFEKSESGTGNPQYVWQFRITAGKSKDIEIRYWTSLLPQARWKAVETLVAVGVKAAGSIAKFSKSDVLGKPCIIEVFHDVYEGRDTHKVRKVYPPNEETIKFAKADRVPF
jgi:hypothetical protein